MEGLSLQYCSANYIPLTPISFLERASSVYADKTSIIYGAVRFSWQQTYERCLKIASALNQLGVSRNDTVATLAPNIPQHYELHFGIPMAGAIISALNTMSDASTLAFLLQQVDAKLLFVDYQFVEVATNALESFSGKNGKTPPRLIVIPECDQQSSSLALKRTYSGLIYDDLLAMGGSEFKAVTPDSEFDPISVNFTSGSTGDPKGVVYSHRAAYLNSLAEIFRFQMRQMPVFLWTVDMFRCNGWSLTWTMAALGGANICIRNVTAEIIFNSVALHKVNLFCGPPSLLKIIADAELEQFGQIPGKVKVIVAGALPNSSVLNKVEELGFNVVHGYGMTEVLGPAIVRPLESESDSRDNVKELQEKSNCLEGLHNLLIEGVDVKDPNTMKSVPHDGKTIGEVMFRSNALMSGYLKNPEATEEAFRGGWYHTRDLGVRHPSGFIQMKDRARDIINSGGESISSLEVEAVLLSHPEVSEAAVVAKPDADLKEVPCAFVKLKEGSVTKSEEIIKFCGGRLPDNMTPKIVVFGDLPVNFTGKVQKYFLRKKARAFNVLLE